MWGRAVTSLKVMGRIDIIPLSVHYRKLNGKLSDSVYIKVRKKKSDLANASLGA